ncbi:hypothetical protein V1520DRAFT_371118 [Lipomyces starkeyi]|uniref:Zn(2)-C6 fungal-type domain-containing protein n=1 Tax=Lipomyces starkeyi NRRL Y-11557 TaxID=675824 RepID=A0A1E3QAQ7_LIPST|nr:hypothetical protein LIPSTDRAFT_68807 [Lipomyces starkeyi NRRL Y-11557]
MSGNDATPASTGQGSGDASQTHRSGHLQQLSPAPNLPWQPNPPPYYPQQMPPQRMHQQQHGTYPGMMQHPQLRSHTHVGAPSSHSQEVLPLRPFQQGAVLQPPKNVQTELTLPPILSPYPTPVVDNAPAVGSATTTTMSPGHYGPHTVAIAGHPYLPAPRAYEDHSQHGYVTPQPVAQLPPPRLPVTQETSSAMASTGSETEMSNGVMDGNSIGNLLSVSSIESGSDGPPKKKLHFKSRNGCLICKKRKIKCDEVRPKCRNCLKHGVNCEYAKEVLEYGFSSLPGPFAGAIPGLSHSTIVSPDLNMQHLSLLMHYVVHTSHSLSNMQSAENVSIWSQTVPQVACRFPFLMYSIFALAATHILATTASTFGEEDDKGKYAAKRQEYEALGVYYRQRALEAFRSAINEPRSHEHLQAALFASVLLSIDAFAYQEENGPEDDGSAKDPGTGNDVEGDSPSRPAAHQQKMKSSEPQIISIDRWIPLHKGIGAVLMEWRMLDVESEIFSQWNLNWTILPLGERKLQYLSDMIGDQYPESVKIYNEPIKLLEQLITFQSTEFGQMVGGGIVRYLLAWPFRCSNEFITRLRTRNSVALVVHIHFLTVLCLAIGPKWWPELTTRKDIRTIARLLGKDWEPWFEWPRKQLPFEIWP